MRSQLIIIFFLLISEAFSQDKVYFLNGTSQTCKVLEISDEEILISSDKGQEKIERKKLLLIHYKNGMTETINTPTQSVIFNPAPDKRAQNERVLTRPHYISLNTAALCNADVSVFYEYLTQSKKAGFGIMGAYNFNMKASFQNFFIVSLPNSKKNYDLGVTASFYPGGFARRTAFYCGVMMKYTHISFDSQIIVNTPNGNTVEYRQVQASQLATLLTLGTHTNFKNNFFMRTLFGIGGFNLKGDYKREFNNSFFGNNYTFLPKAYFGFNLGFNL